MRRQVGRLLISFQTGRKPTISDMNTISTRYTGICSFALTILIHVETLVPSVSFVAYSHFGRCDEENDHNRNDKGREGGDDRDDNACSCSFDFHFRNRAKLIRRPTETSYKYRCFFINHLRYLLLFAIRSLRWTTY